MNALASLVRANHIHGSQTVVAAVMVKLLIDTSVVKDIFQDDLPEQLTLEPVIRWWSVVLQEANNGSDFACRFNLIAAQFIGSPGSPRSTGRRAHHCSSQC